MKLASKLALQYFLQGVGVVAIILLSYMMITGNEFDISEYFWYVVVSGWFLGLIKVMYLEFKSTIYEMLKGK